MIHKLQAFLKNLSLKKFISGSLILLIGSNLLNVLNYIFQFLMGRMLKSEQYGIFTSLNSLLFLILVIGGGIQNTLVPFVSQYKGREEYGQLKKIFTYLTKIIFAASVILYAVSLAITPWLTDFLNIESTTPLFILSGVLLFSFPLMLNRSLLQGLQKFGHFTINNLLEGIIKLASGIILVMSGYAVAGALGGIVTSVCGAYLLSLPSVHRVLKGKKAPELFKPKIYLRHIIPTLQVFLTSICLIAFLTTDIILVKHYLTSLEAGLYGALSMIGKIIFFGSGTIGQVLLPLASEAKIKNQNHKKFLNYSLIFVLTSSLVLVGIYHIWPEMIVTLIYGKDYLAIAQFLSYFGIIMIMYTLVSIIVTYFIAIKDYRYLPLLAAGIAVQAMFIVTRHQTIKDVMNASLMSIAFVLGSCLVLLQFFERKKVSL